MRRRVHNRTRDRGGEPIRLAWPWAWPPSPSEGLGGAISKHGRSVHRPRHERLRTNKVRKRRETLLLGAAALASCLVQNVEAGKYTEMHGISAVGDLK